jgi:hypothetical protein
MSVSDDQDDEIGKMGGDLEAMSAIRRWLQLAKEFVKPATEKDAEDRNAT